MVSLRGHDIALCSSVNFECDKLIVDGHLNIPVFLIFVSIVAPNMSSSGADPAILKGRGPTCPSCGSKKIS